MTAPNTSLDIHSATVRHRKRGTTYTVIANATLQTSAPIADDTALVIYQGEDGKFWARPAAEFFDGRFEHIAPPDE
jgi:hypothetical protein